MKYTHPTVPDETPEGVLQEYRRRVRPLIIEFLIWITALAFMAIIYGFLKILEAEGYAREKLEILENIDFIATAGILVVGGFDMFMKFLASAWSGK